MTRRIFPSVVLAAVACTTAVHAAPSQDADVKVAGLLMGAVSRCWNAPLGRPESRAVTFMLFLNRDGSVARPPQLSADSQAQAMRDPYVRAAAETARRAILNCAPYKLPADRYDIWSQIAITFDGRATAPATGDD